MLRYLLPPGPRRAHAYAYGVLTMAFVLCAPVVAQIGVLGVVPDDGAWEPWCEISEERWDVGYGLGSAPLTADSHGEIELSANCSAHGGVLRWLWEDPDEDQPNFGRSVIFQPGGPALDLRGRRIFLRIEPGDGDLWEWGWALEEINEPGSARRYEWFITAGEDYSGEGQITIWPSNINPDFTVPGDTEMGPQYRWLGFYFAADGSRAEWQTSADCSTWETQGVQERQEGAPPLGIVSAEIFLQDFAGLGPERTAAIMSAIYIETPGAEPTPEATP
ncbi:MAG: hypothetical protein EA417_13825 [Gammaproteobacteria bacterium]|nr:MAG: hypothetical protein EA417_13825 [Gammaproteobacteria bacterium]